MKLSRIKNLKNNIKDFLKLFFPLKIRNEKYDLNYAHKADSHAKNNMSIIETNWIADNLCFKKKILDIGCNTGASLNNLFAKIIDVSTIKKIHMSPEGKYIKINKWILSKVRGVGDRIH